MFKKQDKIEFFSTIPGLADTFPIIPAKEWRPKWVASCKEDFSKHKSYTRPSHLYQCPGIFDLFKTGYIIPLWHDTVIKTRLDEEAFAYVHPSEMLAKLREGDPVGTHPYELQKWLPRRPWSIAPIMKFNTPWNVIAPKGVKFLMTAMSYTDTHEFEACQGILDPSVSTELNVQGYWNIKEGEVRLNAGMPLAHLIPITEKQYDYEVRDANSNDLAWLQKREYFTVFGFNLNKSTIKNVYNKHFRRK